MKECENSCKMEVLHESHEKVLKAEIAELKDKVLEQELHNDYLSSQLLEYEDRIERQRRVLKELQEKEKKRAFARCGL
jgi:Rps23 Pro-64 3,4-dihydroxylase Tpa1-like proline 4-hydroxylase